MAQRKSQTGASQAPPAFTELNDLASQKIGGKIVFATDDWFCTAENLLKPEEATFDPTTFTDYGKEMDGWETRRKRKPGHDWCIIQLGSPGVIHGVDIDTAWFSGNYAPRASLQAAVLESAPAPRQGDLIGTEASAADLQDVASLQSETWTELVPMTTLGAGYSDTRHNYLAVGSRQRWTHLRLNIYPDGGVARLRVFGQVVHDWGTYPTDQILDLVAMLNGGICVGYSNVHYGHARNMIGPGRSAVMEDGWETARRLDRPAVLTADSQGVLQVPGNEWAAFKLGHVGTISKIVIDTNHFKGNFPDSCKIEACHCPDADRLPSGPWTELLSVKKLSAHREHVYEGVDILECGVISHVRITMAPDGGISRLRLWGHLAKL